MGRALYRKYRSRSLSEIVGQQHVTSILQRSLQQGRIAHAYLLTGPRGVGKTSIARILAHEINQLAYSSDDSQHLDIIEIDAASNNGVDDIRDLRNKVQVAPVSSSKKIYIIDEVHMLSKAAFNALLKTLEEPPEHVIFILATTDVDKLPATIISRTQRFSLRAMAKADGAKHLKMIAQKEGIAISDDALEMLAERGDGSFRNSVSLLDQLASLADENTGITPELIETTLGLAPTTSVSSLLSAVKARDAAAIITLLDEFEQSGVQATVLTGQLISAVQQQLAQQPSLVGLLDALLEVNKSSHPSLKLLTVLVSQASPKPKTAALAAPAPTISAPVEALVQPKPQITPSQAAAPSAPLPPKQTPVQKAPATTTKEPAPQEPPKKLPTPTGDAPAVDWPALVEHIRAHHIALYSVLSKCTPQQNGDLLVIYTGSAFYKKKLDDAKYRTQLMESLEALGNNGLTVETVPTPPPPKDSTAAAVAALMGGGEEVAV